MAQLTTNHATGEREFRVPFAESMPNGPFQGRAELVLTTTPPGDRPSTLMLKFYPSEFEFQAKLPKLVQGSPLQHRAVDMSMAAATAQPVVIYQAEPGVLERVPPGLSDLPALERFLRSGPALFDLAEYRLAGVEFQDRPRT